MAHQQSFPPASRPTGVNEWTAKKQWPPGMRFEDAETDDGFIARIDHPMTDVGTGASSLE